jgi:hypothetical protein
VWPGMPVPEPMVKYIDPDFIYTADMILDNFQFKADYLS